MTWAAVGVTAVAAGTSAYGAYNASKKGNGLGTPQGWNPISANNTTISPTLSGAISGVGSPGYNASSRIGANYDIARQNLGRKAAPGSYADQRLTTQQGLDTGNLESTIGGSLGSTAYSNALQNRDYGQNLGLAQQIGDLNKPSQLQQIFQGVGSVAKPLAAYYGMRGRAPQTVNGGDISGDPSLSLYDPSQTGYGRYSNGF